MAVDLMGHTKMDDQIAIQEATSAGMRNMERLIYLLSHQNQTQAQAPVDCREITDSTVSKFKKVISILNRTGHARFRRGPVMPARSEIPALPASAQAAAAAQSQTLTLDFSKPCPNLGSEISNSHFSKESFSISPPISSANSSFMSSITGDGSVSNGKQGSSLLLAAAPAVSAGKPPLSSSYKKKCHGHGHSDDLSGKYSLSGRCHCSKKRYFTQRPAHVSTSLLISTIVRRPPCFRALIPHRNRPIRQLGAGQRTLAHQSFFRKPQGKR